MQVIDILHLLEASLVSYPIQFQPSSKRFKRPLLTNVLQIRYKILFIVLNKIIVKYLLACRVLT